MDRIEENEYLKDACDIMMKILINVYDIGVQEGRNNTYLEGVKKQEEKIDGKR